MKKIYILAALMLFASVAVYAKIITVNNNLNSAGMYTKVQDAHDAASVDDTLFIHASATSYGNLTINRRLTIIGEGHTSVRGGAATYGSQLGTVYIDSVSKVISGTKLLGLNLGSVNSNISDDKQPNSCILERCKITGNVYVKGKSWLVMNNVINNFYLYGTLSSGHQLFNNIIYQFVSGHANMQNCLVQNNLFLMTSNYYYYFLSQSVGNVFSSNIFYVNSGNLPTIFSTTASSNNTFNKNLNSSVVSGIVLPGTGNSGSNNLNATDPVFAINSEYFFDNWSKSDWKLAPASPGKNYGADGKDVGIYGGQYIWTPACFTGDPGLPYIQSIEVQNAVVQPGDKVKFNIKAKSGFTK